VRAAGGAVGVARGYRRAEGLSGGKRGPHGARPPPGRPGTRRVRRLRRLSPPRSAKPSGKPAGRGRAGTPPPNSSGADAPAPSGGRMPGRRRLQPIAQSSPERRTALIKELFAARPIPNSRNPPAAPLTEAREPRPSRQIPLLRSRRGREPGLPQASVSRRLRGLAEHRALGVRPQGAEGQTAGAGFPCAMNRPESGDAAYGPSVRGRLSAPERAPGNSRVLRSQPRPLRTPAPSARNGAIRRLGS
jgi:hypothetical protein